MTITSTPSTQKALHQSPEGGFPLVLSASRSLPRLNEGQILIRVHASALNPTDYKMPTFFPSAGAVCGCDFAGRVVALHPSVTSPSTAGKQTPLKIGDSVFGAVHGSNPLERANGAFAEYVAAEADLMVRFPADATMEWEQAAAWGGIGWGTLGIALWDEERGLGLEWPWGRYEGKAKGGQAPPEEKGYVLVNGGATATGTLAVQLLRLAGYKPLATCSPKHRSLLSSLGAVETFDYNNPSCSQDIRTATSNRLQHVLDCIADTGSAQLCYSALSRAGGRYACLELPSQSSLQARKAVRWRFVMGYEIFGREIALSNGYERAADVTYRQKAARWASDVQGLFDGGWLKGHPVEVIKGSWEESVLTALERLKKGEARGVKLVVRII